MRAGERVAQCGFSYIALLAMVAVMGLGLAAIGPMWAEQTRREREDDLLSVGQLYAEALARYRAVSPGSDKRYPVTLDALLLDVRFVGTERHLRTLYPDPIDPSRPWGLVRDSDGGIRGVFSQSEAAPLRIVPIDVGRVALPAATRYAAWQFVVRAE